jgi:hypothetical protein
MAKFACIFWVLLLPLLALALSCMCSARPAHYYAVRYHPAVRSVLPSSRSRAPHLRDVTPTSPEQTIDLLRSAYVKDYPLVIRGGVAHWPAAGTWSPKHIVEKVGRNEKVVLQTGVTEQEECDPFNTDMGWFADRLTRQEQKEAERQEKETGEEAEEKEEEKEEEREDEDEESTEEQQVGAGQADGGGAAKRTPEDTSLYMAEEFDWVKDHPGLAGELRLEDLRVFWQNELSWNGMWNGGDFSKSFSSVANWLLAPWWESRNRAEQEQEADERETTQSWSFMPSEREQALDSRQEQEKPKKGEIPTAGVSVQGFETAFWMGSAGARTGWHLDHDFQLNVLCHLYGRKRLWLASPDQTPAIYPSNKYDAVSAYINCSIADVYFCCCDRRRIAHC